MMLELGIGMVLFSGYSLYTRLDKSNKICDYKELNALMGDGVKCSKHVRLSEKQSCGHISLIAPCGMKKTRGVIMPNVNDLENCSIVCTDPSGEIQRTCRTDKKEYVLNPFSIDTIGYDPLQNCRSEFEVRKLAKMLLENGMATNGNSNNNGNQQEWVDMAKPLLTSYMLMNYYTKKYNFYQMIVNVCTKDIEFTVLEKDEKGKTTLITSGSIMQEIYESKIESAIVQFKSFLQSRKSEGTLSSIRTVMNTCLQLWFDENIKRLVTKPNVDLAKIRQEESILYIQIPERHSKYYSPLVSTLLAQIFDIFLDNDGLQTYFLIDEFANCCGKIPDIKELLATIRKHGMSVVAAMQSLNQLFTIYGELQGKELNELFQTILVCGGLKDSATYISDLLGTKEYRENNTTKTKPLMTSADVRLLPDDKMLIISKNKRPVIDDMLDIVA